MRIMCIQLLRCVHVCIASCGAHASVSMPQGRCTTSEGSMHVLPGIVPDAASCCWLFAKECLRTYGEELAKLVRCCIRGKRARGEGSEIWVYGSLSSMLLTHPVERGQELRGAQAEGMDTRMRTQFYTRIFQQECRYSQKL